MNTRSASRAEAPVDSAPRPQGAGLGRAGARLPLADGAQLCRGLPHRRERTLAPAACDAGLHDGRPAGLPRRLGAGRHAPCALRQLRARPGGRVALSAQPGQRPARASCGAQPGGRARHRRLAGPDRPGDGAEAGWATYNDLGWEMVDVRVWQGSTSVSPDTAGRTQGSRVGHWTFHKALRPLPGAAERSSNEWRPGRAAWQLRSRAAPPQPSSSGDLGPGLESAVAIWNEGTT